MSQKGSERRTCPTDWPYSTTSFVTLTVVFKIMPKDLQNRHRAAIYWPKHRKPNRMRKLIGTGAVNNRKVEEAVMDQWEE